MKLTVRLVVASLLIASSALAQDDIVTRARQLATSGNRTEALRLLGQHLSAHPEDLDAQTLLGTVLSWDHQYDRARRVLESVVTTDPKNLDARLALIRTEIWAGNRERAQQLATEALARFPNDPDLIALKRQSGTPAAGPRREAIAGFHQDDYRDSDRWSEADVAVAFGTVGAPFIVRAAHARRFGSNDGLLEVESYPRFGTKTYAYLAAGWSPDARLYPRSRFGAELFHGFRGGWEASVGARRLNFPEAVNLYTASASKYVRAWLFTGRLYATSETTSGLLMARRYFGPEGQYAALRLGRGSLRDEIRSSADVEALDLREIAGEAKLMLGSRWSLQLGAGIGRGKHGRGDRTTTFLALGRAF